MFPTIIKKPQIEVTVVKAKTAPVSASPTCSSVYTCPISLEIMVEPVITKQGYTFEKNAILNWLRDHRTCPISREVIFATDLVPNKALQNIIENLRKNGRLPEKTEPIALLPPIQTQSLPRMETRWIPVERTHYSSLRSVTAADLFAMTSNQSPRNVSVVTPPRTTRVLPVVTPLRMTRAVSIDLPENPDFSYLHANSINMVASAYRTVTRLNKWEFMRNYIPDPETGFQYSIDTEFVVLRREVDNDYGNLHSGTTIGITMRYIEYIAKNGFDSFRTMIIENSRNS